MNEDWLDEEIRLREKDRAQAGHVVEGAGSRGTPRKMSHMASTRLDGSLIRQLRAIAQQRGVTVSDLLREGANRVVQDALESAQPRMTSSAIEGRQRVLVTGGASGEAYALHR
jgi:hypothetical protein